MVLTKPELIASLQHEVHILLHLASKIDADRLDYRPTPKQRTTLELLKYLTVMGPVMVTSARTGAFDVPAWTAGMQTAEASNIDQVLASIASQKELFAEQIGAISDDEFRGEIEIFGRKTSRGAFIVNMVLCGYAAYRTQLFCYLKACGRDELNTMNLWAGVDAPM